MFISSSRTLEQKTPVQGAVVETWIKLLVLSFREVLMLNFTIFHLEELKTLTGLISW